MVSTPKKRKENEGLRTRLLGRRREYSYGTHAWVCVTSGRESVGRRRPLYVRRGSGNCKLHRNVGLGRLGEGPTTHFVRVNTYWGGSVTVYLLVCVRSV